MKIINIETPILDSIENKVEPLVDLLFKESNRYAPHLVQTYYNDQILPQAVVDWVLSKNEGTEDIQINVPQIGLIIYLKYNEGDGRNESIKGYLYSTELIQGRK